MQRIGSCQKAFLMPIRRGGLLDLLLRDGAFPSRENPEHGLLDLEATVFMARMAGLKKMLTGRMTTGRGSPMCMIGKKENANPVVPLKKEKIFQEKDEERMVRSTQATGELIFKVDERFADLEFNAIAHDLASRSLILSVVCDPADNSRIVKFNNIYALNISGFGLQNVISHIEFSRGGRAVAEGFLKIAEADGFNILAEGVSDIGDFFVGIFVPANGAIIYAVCDEVEKISDSGVCIYRI